MSKNNGANDNEPKKPVSLKDRVTKVAKRGAGKRADEEQIQITAFSGNTALTIKDLKALVQKEHKAHPDTEEPPKAEWETLFEEELNALDLAGEFGVETEEVVEKISPKEVDKKIQEAVDSLNECKTEEDTLSNAEASTPEPITSDAQNSVSSPTTRPPQKRDSSVKSLFALTFGGAAIITGILYAIPTEYMREGIQPAGKMVKEQVNSGINWAKTAYSKLSL